MIIMYYDDNCPICRTEALHMAAKKPEAIRIIPIADALEDLAKFGISEDDAMTYLCVQDEHGQIQKGMDAVRLLYTTAELPFASAFSLPVVKYVSDRVYPIFARNRNRIPSWITKFVYGSEVSECNNGACGR